MKALAVIAYLLGFGRILLIVLVLMAIAIAQRQRLVPTALRAAGVAVDSAAATHHAPRER